MTKWTIEGFQSLNPTGFSRQVSGSEQQIRSLLERLAARHLTDDEIADASLGSRTDFEIQRDKVLGQPVKLMTTGSDHFYVAREHTA
jgi:hypothetical protein